MKTLVVEDDFTSRLLMQKMLAELGECHVAVNGAEAVCAFRHALEIHEPYRLVCLDIMMPEMDGQAALAVMREIENEFGIDSTDGSKIIMTTALGDMKNVAGAYYKLCDGYMVKPIQKQLLMDILRQQGLIAPATESVTP